MPEYLFPSLFIFPCVLAFAAATDLLTFTIPNRLSLALVIAFFICSNIANFPLDTMMQHLSASLLLLVSGFIMFARGWIGGGDAKLLASAGLWVGLKGLLPFILWTAILGGNLAVLLIAYRRMLPPLWLIGQPWAMRLHDPKEGIPYGVAIAGAGLIVYPQTIWMTGIAS